MKIATLAVWVAFLNSPGFGQTVAGRFENRAAWTLKGEVLRVTILESGGHLAEVTLEQAGSVNPLWIPARPARPYGSGPTGRFMSGLMGHNVCFPYWGTPSPAEAAAGMALHGETGLARWRLVSSDAAGMTVAADLAESSTRFTRRVRLDGRVAEFVETAENLSALDRPVGWCEHASLGAPFLERGVTTFYASLSRGYADDRPEEFAWPAALAGGVRLDLFRLRASAAGPGFVNHYLVDPGREYGYFAALNPKLGLLFGYLFPRGDFPWLNVWESLTPTEIVRGMEFSNTPVHASARGLVKKPEVFGTPAFEWLDGKGKLTKRFWIFLARVAPDYRGVAEVRRAGGRLEVVEQETGRVLALGIPASGE